MLAALALSGCYRSHEAVVADASVGDAGNACGMGSFVEVRFEPPLDGGGRIDQARFQGIEAEASVNGVRVHLDLCPDPSGPCPQDAVIAGIGADVAAQLSIPDGWTGVGPVTLRSYELSVIATDERRCAGCGGELQLIAGMLNRNFSSVDPSRLAIDLGRETCHPDGCVHPRAIVASLGAMRVEAAQGETAQDGPLFLRVAVDYQLSTCGISTLPGVGLAAWPRPRLASRSDARGSGRCCAAQRAGGSQITGGRA